MAFNLDLGKLAAEAGKGLQQFVEKTASDVVKAIDQDGNGQLDIGDLQVVADRIGASIEDAKRRAELDRLKPIFLQDIEQPNFVLSKMIRVVEKDKQYTDSPVCQGAIGFRTVTNDMQVINIFRENVDIFGLKYFPVLEEDVYYVDPSDRNRYISLDEYFVHLKTARVVELQKIAQSLGAKHFRVTYIEKKKSITSQDINAQAKVKSIQGDGSMGAEHQLTQMSATALSIEAEMSFPGHAPVKPELVYLKNEVSIRNLIEMRMDPTSPLQHQRFNIELSNSSGIKEKDAVKIDAVLKTMKVSGNVTVTSQAQDEARKLLEYEIDF